jgi:hypothetical protein
LQIYNSLVESSSTRSILFLIVGITRNAMKAFLLNAVHFLLAVFLFGVTACGTHSSGDSDEDVSDICRDPVFADFDENLYEIDYEPYLTEGSTMNYDSNHNFVVLGYEKEGPDKEPHGGITLIFDEPRFTAFRDDGGAIAYDEDGLIGDNWDKKCASKITSATLSTSDVRVGTGAELNGKLYSLVNPPTIRTPCKYEEDDDKRDLRPSYIEFFYVSRDVAHGWFCVEVEQVSPETGEPFKIGGYFAIRQ